MSLIAFAGAIDDVYGGLLLMCITFNVEVELKRIYPNPSGNLKTDVVIKAFSKKYTTLDASNVGRLAVLLARYCFFGDRVLHASTLKGKGKRPPLDLKTYECLISCYSDMTKTEFRNKIQPKIQRALVDFLKRNKKL